MKGFTLLEIVVAMGVSLIMALGVLTMITNQNHALTHFRLRSEMVSLMLSATVSGSGCKSVQTAGGITPLAPCGTAGTPAQIDVLFADGTRVDAGSGYLLRATCQAGYYAMEIKSAVPTKIDPFNQQQIGAAYFAPAILRFAEKAFLAAGCP